MSAGEVEALLAPFDDVAQLDEYTRYALAMLVDYGILQGTTENTLAPDELLTRAQMAALCSRLVAIIG